MALIGSRCAVNPSNYSLAAGFIHLGAGVSCGTTGIAAGYAIGLVGDSVSILNHFEWRHGPYVLLVAVRSGICSRAESICGYDSHPDLCRGPGALRVGILCVVTDTC